MNEAGRKAGRERDAKAVAVPVAEPIVSVPWQPRTDDKSALLVSERTTVFDRKAAVPPPADRPGMRCSTAEGST